MIKLLCLLLKINYLFNELLTRGDISSKQRRQDAGYENKPYSDGTFCNISGSPACGFPGSVSSGEASLSDLKGPYDGVKLGLNFHPVGRGVGFMLDVGEIGYNFAKGSYSDASSGFFGLVTGKIVEVGLGGFAGASAFGREIVERAGGVTSWFAEKAYGQQPWRKP
jgi:hypothetical protein